LKTVVLPLAGRPIITSVVDTIENPLAVYRAIANKNDGVIRLSRRKANSYYLVVRFYSTI